jgi:hypothetical protein
MGIMKKRVLPSLLLLGFLLFVSCKSSLYDLCPNLFSKSYTVKINSEKIPSCHQTKQSHESSENTDCECPLAYQDYTLASERISKVLSIHSFYKIDFFYETYNSVPRLKLLRVSSFAKFPHSYSFDSDDQYLSTIRLLI